ncbi:MAG TPA: energy transducer TonB [Nevskiaceae bacterium]|nr:energy transducer TonB [Nevskiaceae bacterium]
MKLGLNELRLPLAAVLATALTFGLFFTLQGLIATGTNPIADSLSRPQARFIRVKRAEDVQRVERKAERPPAPDRPPAPPSAPTSAATQQVTQALSFGDVAADVEVDSGDAMGLGAGSDGDYLPIVKVSPVYPPRALQRQIEGWVLVEFTVSATGTVKDVRAIDADPTGVFEQAAIDAAQKFRYKPRVVAGKPVDVTGVQNVIRFELEK